MSISSYRRIIEKAENSPAYKPGGIFHDSSTGKLILPSTLDSLAVYPILGTLLGCCRVLCAIKTISLNSFYLLGSKKQNGPENRLAKERIQKASFELIRGISEILLVGSYIGFLIDRDRKEICDYLNRSKLEILVLPGRLRTPSLSSYKYSSDQLDLGYNGKYIDCSW